MLYQWICALYQGTVWIWPFVFVYNLVAAIYRAIQAAKRNKEDFPCWSDGRTVWNIFLAGLALLFLTVGPLGCILLTLEGK